MTAEEFWNSRPAGCSPEDTLKAFAEFHVKAALEAAAKNVDYREYGDYGGTCIDKKSILTAYPESNIK